MKKIEVETFKFSELSENVQKRLVEKEIEALQEGWYPDIDFWAEEIENAGFQDPKIKYSGFWSQGDGARFTCPRQEIPEKYLQNVRFETLKKFIKDNFTFELYGNDNHYVHEKTVNIEIIVSCLNYEKYDKVAAYVNSFLHELEIVILAEARGIMKKLYKSFRQDYDYCTSEEIAIENIISNDYDYLKNGIEV